MKNEIIFSNKYDPLWGLMSGEHKEVDTVILTGGRGSGKSFLLSVFAVLALSKKNWDVLYARYTNTSIVDSIKPEVDEKIRLLNINNLTSTKTHIYNSNKNRISFKGVKTGSKKQTAKLKSLSGFNCFIVDEAEEIPDFETYEKVFLSIRSANKRNLTVLVLNPVGSSHWIYTKFFEERGIETGSNTIKDNVCYIHTSFLDVKREYLANNIVRYYEQLKITSPERYDHIVLGKWKQGVDDRVFNNWHKISIQEYNKLKLKTIYGVDWGKNHIFGIVELKYDTYNNNLYCHELNSKSENDLIAELDTDIRASVNLNGGIIIHLFSKLNIPKDAEIVCDSAVPDNILLLREYGWEYAFGIDKPAGSVMSGITLLHDTNVFYTETSKQINYEFHNYAYNRDRMGVIDDEVIKLNDDLIDPIRYGRRYFEKLYNS